MLCWVHNCVKFQSATVIYNLDISFHKNIYYSAFSDNFRQKLNISSVRTDKVADNDDDDNDNDYIQVKLKRKQKTAGSERATKQFEKNKTDSFLWPNNSVVDRNGLIKFSTAFLFFW